MGVHGHAYAAATIIAPYWSDRGAEVEVEELQLRQTLLVGRERLWQKGLHVALRSDQSWKREEHAPAWFPCLSAYAKVGGGRFCSAAWLYVYI